MFLFLWIRKSIVTGKINLYTREECERWRGTMEKYTRKDEPRMLTRYLMGNWTQDGKELRNFLDDLSNADTTVREVASTIELNMAKYFIENKQFGNIEPHWLIDYYWELKIEYSRGELLEAMQGVLNKKNLAGYEYTEEVQLSRFVWNRFKYADL